MIHSLIRSIKKLLLNSYYVRQRAERRTRQVPFPEDAWCLVEEGLCKNSFPDLTE